MSTNFNPIVDIPLLVAVCGLLLLYFRRWARTATLPNVDLRARLPKACLRVLVLFTGILFFSWLGNVAAWSLFIAALILSMAVGLVLGSMATIEFIPAAFVILIREWAFGFPQLVLQPQRDPISKPKYQPSKLDGSVGHTLSALRPCGEIMIDGQVYQAASESGDYIDADRSITVVAFKNSLATVRET